LTTLNTWNKIRYTVYSPVYDWVGRLFSHSRQISISQLNIKENDKVLLIGCGTGLDLEFIPANCLITATDITPVMVERTRKRNQKLSLNMEAMVMDGQKLSFPDQSFDKIILHLILAVIPDPVACIREAERLLKSGGQIAVFDKFLPKVHTISWKRKIINPVAIFLFTYINRRIENIVSKTSLHIISDKDADFGGIFRILLLNNTRA
jgi:phosphatidylethanolamine/phosphatidyl-N-methylethanolamine N-methyltransferase